MVWDYMSTDEYQNVIFDLQQRLEYQDKNGKSLFIYPCGHSYYGDMEAGQRSGNGKWAHCKYLHSEFDHPYDGPAGDFFEGEWKDDYPNGKGVVYRTIINDDSNDFEI